MTANRVRQDAPVASLFSRLFPAALVASAPLLAQEGDPRLDAELAFAEGLAQQYAFVDLAERVLDGAAGLASGTTAEHRLQIARCELSAIGAANESDATRRRELFESALGCYEGFIGANGGSAVRGEAEAGLVAASVTFGQYLERDMEEAVGEQLEQFKERQAEVLSRAVELTEDLATGFRTIDRTPAQQVEFLTLLFQRAQMLATIARSNQDDFFAQLARDTYEELAIEAGFESIAAMYAFRGIGDTFADAGNWEEALGYYEAVIENSIPLDRQTWEDKVLEYDLGAAEIQTFFEVMAIGLPGLIQAYRNTGVSDQATTYAVHMINVQRTIGANLDKDAYNALLSCARILIQAGGHVGGDLADWEGQWFATEEEMKEAVRQRRHHRSSVDLSMEIAQQVADENEGEWMQIKAQQLISEISSLPGQTLEPSMVVDAAQGELYSGNEAGALKMLRGVLVTLDSADEATRLELGPRVMNLIGVAYRRTDRFWEAAFAFEDAVKRFPGDEEMDGKNAAAFLTEVTRLKRKVGKEGTGYAVLEDLERTAEDLVSKNPGLTGGGENGVAWRRAMRAYQQGKWSEARSNFARISDEYDQWEMAQVLAASCKYYDDDFQGTLADLRRYLDEVVPDPARQSDSPKLQEIRKNATGVADFFVGSTHYNLEQWQQVVDVLGDYESRHGSATDQRKNVSMDYVTRALIALGDLDRALEAFSKMQTAYADSEITANAATTIYVNLSKQYQQTGDAKTLALMAGMLEMSNAKGGATYTTLRNEARHWEDLGEYDKALKALERVVERYGSDPEQADKISAYVLPSLGHIYLAKKDVEAAKATLDPLVLGPDAKPTRSVLNDWARALTGWVELDGSRIVEVQGASGSAEEFQLAVEKLDALSRSRKLTKWVDCGWFETKFRVAYTYYSWSKIDSSRIESMKSQLGQITSNFCEDWSCINDCEVPEDAPADQARAEELKKWFDWLNRK